MVAKKRVFAMRLKKLFECNEIPWLFVMVYIETALTKHSLGNGHWDKLSVPPIMTIYDWFSLQVMHLSLALLFVLILCLFDHVLQQLVCVSGLGLPFFGTTK